MKKIISNNYVLKLKEASDSLKGTSSYNKYYMMQESKIGKKWVFTGWCVPYKNHDLTVKKVKNNIYLIDGDDRYTLTSAANEILQVVDDFPQEVA